MLFVTECWGNMIAKRQLIIDTDPGVDDGMAIQLALSSPELEVVALTTVYGNASVGQTTINALRLLELANFSNIPVAKGADSPMVGSFTGGVPHVHGEDGQGNTFASAPGSKPVEQRASSFLVDQIKKHPGLLTIVALGPLTNLAQALQLDPSISKLVAEVVIMGGNAFCAGNATPAAEANILADPHAADLVLGADWPVTLIGLDVTHRINMKSATLRQLRNQTNALGKHVAATLSFYQQFYERVNRIDGIYVHDSSTIAYLLAPALFAFEHYPVRVDSSLGIGRGKTWPSIGESDQEGTAALEPWANRPSVKIGVSVDGSGVIDLIVSRLIRP